MASVPSRKPRSGLGGKKERAIDRKKEPPLSLTRRVLPSVSSPALLDTQAKTDHRFRQFLYDFSTLGASLEIVRSHLASLLDVTSPQYNIIMVLANGGGKGISVSDVARRLHVSTAFIAAEGVNLESSGLIEKHRNPNDGRGVLLHLTKLGWERVAQIGPERQKINDHLFGSLTPQNFRHLAETLTSLLDDFNYTVRLIKNVPSSRGQSDSFAALNLKALKEKR